MPEEAKNKLISKVDSSIGNFVSSGNVPTMSAKLSWSHYCEILWFNDDKFLYYIKIIGECNL